MVTRSHLIFNGLPRSMRTQAGAVLVTKSVTPDKASGGLEYTPFGITQQYHDRVHPLPVQRKTFMQIYTQSSLPSRSLRVTFSRE